MSDYIEFIYMDISLFFLSRLEEFNCCYIILLSGVFVLNGLLFLDNLKLMPGYILFCKFIELAGYTVLTLLSNLDGWSFLSLSGLCEY